MLRVGTTDTTAMIIGAGVCGPVAAMALQRGKATTEFTEITEKEKKTLKLVS